MEPFRFRCRAIDIEHSCSHRNEKEPDHPPKLIECVASIVQATQEISFHGIIKSPANSYQIDLADFDFAWINKVYAAGWENMCFRNFGELHNIPNIKPDTLLTHGNTKVVVEIEKSNKKTIWFDFIKILMLIGQELVHFGLLVVPRNYAHKNGVWDLFSEARYYRWCLARFAKVDQGLLSNIAIIGYTQEVLIPGKWARLESSVLRSIKEQACRHFS